jgi:DNA-binding NtrC family response regulator/tetratricopeptide (TPR) repeat protein
MDIFSRARDLYKLGRFKESREFLRSLSGSRLDLSVILLKASVFEMTGDLETAEACASQVLRSKFVTDGQRAVAEFTLARVASARGEIERELAHLQKSSALAERIGDSEQLGWTQLRLLALIANRMGTDSCRSLMASLRHNVSCAGSPTLSAALHLVVADADGKLGLIGKSKRHVHLAQTLIAKYPNVWLEGWAEGTLLALALVQSDIPSAIKHGQRALELGNESGSRAVNRNALANLGRLHYTAGEYSTALDYLNRASEESVPGSEQAEGILESIARVHLAEGRLHESERLIDGTVISDRDSVKSGGYVHRHSLLTKAEVLSRLGKASEAFQYFDEALELAKRSGDVPLEDYAAFLAKESRAVFGMADPRARDNSLTARPPRTSTPDASVLYERAVTSQLLAEGRGTTASLHRDRALRLCRAIANRPAQVEILAAWERFAVRDDNQSPEGPGHSQVLQEVAALLMHSGRPELVAASLIAIVQHLGGITGARALARAADNSEEVLDGWGTITDPAAVRTFAIGTSRNRSIEVILQPRQDVESQATANSIGFIIAVCQEIERGRMDREERLTLWPVDELPAEDDDSVVAGRMRDVMKFARKIAPAHVIVLITGESGTGKEVLARAIHRYSARSRKPFVPFNCTAVPRELLESHLFGFKRGAFTGADRDNPGLIRAAKDGTLFLDEIGELSLDLQPKLLRFLESGEINPLGEPSPFSVNVRIVAATNANLKKLVEEGRFREDLYYRLSVVPIELPPLRERREEIAPLAQHFALKWSHELGKGCIRVAEDLMEHLVVYHWPGNIRQLSNEINRMVAMAEPDVALTLDYFPRALREETEQLKRRANGLDMTVPLHDKLDHVMSLVEREMIKAALRESNGKVEAAAKALGISRKGLYLKRQRLGL